MRFTPRFSITNAIAAALTEIERARGFLDAASLSDEWIDSMRSRAFLLEPTMGQCGRGSRYFHFGGFPLGVYLAQATTMTATPRGQYTSIVGQALL